MSLYFPNQQMVFLALISCILLLLGPVDARPTVFRRQSSTGGSTTLTTVNHADTVAGPMTETCVVTLTPITDSNGQPAVEEVKKCSISIDATPQNNSSVSSSSSSSSTTSASATSSASIASNTIETSSAAVSTSFVASSATSTSSSLTSSVASSSAASSVETVSSAQSTTAANSVTGLTTVSGSVGATNSVPSPTSAPTSALTSTVSPSVTLGAGASVPSAPSADSTSSASGSAAAAETTGTPTAAFQIPGKKLSVLPIGLGVFAGISVIALIVVGLVTYERTKYRKAFRQRKLAESGAAMGYGGMAQRT